MPAQLTRIINEGSPLERTGLVVLMCLVVGLGMSAVALALGFWVFPCLVATAFMVVTLGTTNFVCLHLFPEEK